MENKKIDDHFDPEWYSSSYKDVTLSKMDPRQHYEKYGRLLNRPANSRGLINSDNIANDTKKITTKKYPNAEEYALETLNDYSGLRSFKDHSQPLPKVSFIVTSFNAEDSIERSVNSLLMQNYPNLEVIVCDDMSSDNTWDILNKLKKQSPNALKIIRTNINGGTYLAKNIAIAESSGDILLFQDSDDYSHPDRALIQVLPLIEDSELIATRTKYLRFNPNNKSIIPVADLYSKYGLITLAVWRKAFDEIGYFDAVRKAGDDEWYQRLGHLYGKKRIKSLDVTLYLAELRENSLIADMLTFRSDGSVDQSSSAPRHDYVNIFKSRFNDKTKRRLWYRNNFTPNPLRPQELYPHTISAINPLSEKVYASGCCIPSRSESFKKVISRILPQVDKLFVYLDKFEDIPHYLEKNPKIIIIKSQNAEMDFRDNAKFLMFNKLKEDNDNFYYFTIDDDILYPYDYVRTMISKLEKYENKVVVGVHGVIYEEEPKEYFKRRFVYHFQYSELNGPKLVNNLGTGTVAFHSSAFEVIEPRNWHTGGMVDIFFSKECKEKYIPMVCIDHHANWLVPTEESHGTPNLFNEFREKEEKIVKELSLSSPWGYEAIAQTISTPSLEKLNLTTLLPYFVKEISVSNFFSRFR